MSYRLIKQGNNYYPDMPYKKTYATLTNVVSSGEIIIIRAGRVITLLINDIRVNSDITDRIQIATVSPAPANWNMFVVGNNMGTPKNINPLLYIEPNGKLYIEGGVQNVLTTNRLMGTYTYITNT